MIEQVSKAQQPIFTRQSVALIAIIQQDLRTILNQQGFHSEILIFIQGIFIIVCSPLNIICDNMWNLKSNLIDGSYIKYYFKPGSSLFFFLAVAQ